MCSRQQICRRSILQVRLNEADSDIRNRHEALQRQNEIRMSSWDHTDFSTKPREPCFDPKFRLWTVWGFTCSPSVFVDLRWIFWFALSLEKCSQLIQLLVIRYISTTGCCKTALEKFLFFFCNRSLEYHLYRGVCKACFLIPLLPASRIFLLWLFLLTFKIKKSFNKTIAQWQSKFCCDQCCVKEHF